MKKLLVATGNPGKITMFRDLLGDQDLDLVFLSDLDIDFEDPVENGETIEQNALIKARYYAEISGLPAIADDAGFKIPALDNNPWVKARRWGGELPDNVSDEDWLEFFLQKVENIPWERIDGAFPFARCLYFPDGKHFFQSDRADFFLSKTPRKPYIPGFPLSAVLILPDGRHQLDIPLDDPVWRGRMKRKGLLELLQVL